MVHNDNHVFQYERQIFTNGFFEVTKKLIEQLVYSNPEVLDADHPLSSKVFELMDKLIFDLLLYTSENKTLIDMAKVFTGMLDKNYD